MDIKQSPMRELALFAGAGGGILGGKLLGWRTVCAVERDAYAASILAKRQNDGHLDPFPVWSDVKTFDGRTWRGIVDVISGGFPCQDISVAGGGAGIDGERSGLWREFARIIGEVRPRFAFVENSPALTFRGLGRVLGDLAELGYDAQWCVLGADDVGAPHRRKRIWILAHALSERSQGVTENGRIERQTGLCDRTGRYEIKNIPWWNIDPAELANARNNGNVKREWELRNDKQNTLSGQNLGARKAGNEGGQWRPVESRLGRVANGVANRVDRLRAIGNGQVPAVAARAWSILINRMRLH